MFGVVILLLAAVGKCINREDMAAVEGKPLVLSEQLWMRTQDDVNTSDNRSLWPQCETFLGNELGYILLCSHSYPMHEVVDNSRDQIRKQSCARRGDTSYVP